MSTTTNGVATPKPLANGTPKPDTKKETPVIPLGKTEPGDLPPLEERLHRLNMLYDLQRKHTKYQESFVKLKDFSLKGDQETATLTMRDEVRNEFSTSNPKIIRKVVAFLKEEIQAEIKALEPQLTW